MHRLMTAMLFCALFATPAFGGGPEGFTPLFNGKDLSGFTKHGGQATYKVENGMIVGERGPGPNTFLCTDKPYRNFIFHLKLKLVVPCNSGIQIRSHLREKNDVVWGYQCEVDPSDRAWSAGLYEESNRGWLNPLDTDAHAEARKAFQLEDWNHYVIVANGPHMTTFLNGVPCADLVDPMTPEGFIALQVHNGKQGKILWKDIAIKELPKTPWKPLFNGENLDGWEATAEGGWKVEDGVIHGTWQKDKPAHSILLTEKSYKDFAMKLKFKVNEGNSGLYFRVARNNSGVAVKGFQAEVANDENVGGLYETGGRAWVGKPDKAVVDKFYKPGEWSEMWVTAIGGRHVVHINGRKTVELMNDDKAATEGLIGLQLHGGQDMDVEFKDIEIMEIDPTVMDQAIEVATKLE